MVDEPELRKQRRFPQGLFPKLWPWLVVVAVLWCGFVDIEAWPLSGFHLFSQRRGPNTSALVFEVTTVPVDFKGNAKPGVSEVAQRLTVGELDPSYSKIGWLYTTRDHLERKRRCQAVFDAVTSSKAVLATSQRVLEVKVHRVSYTRAGLDSPKVQVKDSIVDNCSTHDLSSAAK